MKPRFKNIFCIRKEPALSRRRNFRRKQQVLFLFTQKFLLASLTAWLFPMALAVPYGRKSLRSVCLWFVPLLSPAAPRRLPDSPFFVTHYSLVSPPFPPRISRKTPKTKTSVCDLPLTNALIEKSNSTWISFAPIEIPSPAGILRAAPLCRLRRGEPPHFVRLVLPY